jgi:hypothetical protein
MGLKTTPEYDQKASGNYFPNDSDRSGIRDGQVTQQDLAGSISGNIRPYKVYTAFVTQTGTDAPVPTILENTLEGNIVWTRVDTGVYEGTLNGAFLQGKTVCLVTPDHFDSLTFVGSDSFLHTINFYRVSDNVVTLVVQHKNLDKATEDWTTEEFSGSVFESVGTFIKIEVYS